MSKADLIKQFDQEMHKIYKIASDECGYRPTYFLNLVNKEGGYAAAKQLLADKIIQQGLTKLYELNRLDISMENLVLKQPWCQLFSDEELKIARRRLRQLNFEF